MTHNHSDRAGRLLSQATSLTAELSGYDDADLMPDSSFLELGFDSLFMTQLATSYSKEFGVPITFRQLFDEIPNLNTLASFLDAALPEEAAPVTQSPVDPAPTAALAPTPSPSTSPAETLPMPEISTLQGPNSGFAGVLAEQVRLMSEQLQLLQQLHGQAPVAGEVTQSQPANTQQTVALTAPTTPPASSQSENKPDIKMPKGFGPDTNDQTDSNQYSARQLGGVRRLIERYNAKTPTSKRRTQEDRAVHADPRTAAGFNPLWKEMVYPLVVERSKGAYLWDVDGNKYIDILNGFGPNFFGHNAPFVTDALLAQLQNSYEVGPQTPKAGEAARLLCELTGMERVSWVNTGSEAVQAAIRISRTVTGRDKIVVFAGDYHGNFDEVLVRGTNGPKGRRTFPQAPGIPFDSVSNVLVLDYGDPASLAEVRKHASEIAAVLVEPVQSRRPELQPKEFLQELRDITEQEGIVLVFDEVITGFRIRQGGAQEYFGIEADIATYGKIIGGGMPIGVVAGRARFMDTFDGGMWHYGDSSRPTAGVTFFAGTFVRHPLAIEAAFASLNYLKNAGPALQEGINRRATKMATDLNTFFQEEQINIEIPHFASQMFIRNKEESELATLMFYHMRDRGIHVLEGFPSYMTAAHTDEDVETIVAAVKDSVYEMQADGLMPSHSDGTSAPYIRKYDLTDDQRHLWLAAQMSEEASCAFIESDRVDINGPMDEAAFCDAVKATLVEHESFKLRFDADGDYQWVDENMQFDVEQLDLSNQSKDEADEALQALCKSNATTPLDLVNGPLVKTILVKLAENQHVFIIYCHHLIFDGYSAGIVISEIMDRYKSATSTEEFDVAINVPYSAYVSRTQASNESVQTATDYWVDQFNDGAPALVELPTDKTRQPERQYSGATYEVDFGSDLLAAVSDTARQLKISKQMLLYSAFSLLVSRLSGNDDFVISIPAAGQAAQELETVGYCVNMMPVRIKPERSKLFPEYVSEVRRDLLNAVEMQNFSSTELMKRITAPRHLGRLPLSEIVFNYSNYMMDLDVPDCTVTAGENPRHAVFYDLFFQVIETDKTAVVCVDYASSLYSQQTISNWVSQFIALLEDITANPERKIETFQLGQGSEAMLQGLAVDVADSENAISLINAIADASPDASALTFNGTTTSYGDLMGRANEIAHTLQKKGLQSNDIAGVLLERGPDLIASLLAIWKVGAAWLPLDPEFPEERLNFMVTDAKVRFVISDEVLAEQLPITDNFVLLSDIKNDSGSKPAKFEQSTAVESNTRAYVLYTSGSTGKPKGVENTHGALMNFLQAMKQTPGITPEDRLLALTTISFDISILELFLPLTVGARIILASREEAMDGYDLADLIEDHNVTIMQATPGTWRLLLDCDWQGARTLKALCGGEAMQPAVASALLPLVGELWNMYGPTETTVWSSCTRITDAENITVGIPIQNTNLYVITDRGELAPVGVKGNLWIGGKGVATGYLGQPDLTAERFQEDRFAPGRMYNTGDIAFVRSDGTLCVQGRSDNQVKVRGHRIELGELENVLSRHPAIKENALRVYINKYDEPMLASYIVWKGEPTTASELRHWLRKKVPDYMVPQTFTSLEALPLTDNNKVNRNALPEPQINQNVAQARVAPRSENERLIAALWNEMLETNDISVTENFFELGGQSLQVVRMTSLLRKKHGISLSPRAVIFETLEQLAATADRLAS